MKIGIVAGEASGDILGGSLLNTFHQHLSPLDIYGVGGERMIAQSCKSLYPLESLSLMGFFEPLLHLPELIKIRHGLYKQFINKRPDVFIGIDSPDFNLGLELKLRKNKIPVVHYVSPSVWAWRKNRIHKIAKAVDLMLTLLPFEADFYKEKGVPVEFVGHPLADQIPLVSDQKAARIKLGLDLSKTYIAVLPGSRRKEIKYLGELFVTTAEQCKKLRPEIEFITSGINTTRSQEFQNLWNTKNAHIPIKFFEKCSQDVMQAADVILVTSGTATLEALLYKRPMVIAYRTGKVTYQIARHLVDVPFIGLPNLLANELIVPEFIQDEATPERLAEALMGFLNHPEKTRKLQHTFTQIHQKLRCNSSEKAFQAIMTLINQ